MGVIADFSAYPQWALAVKKAEVVIPGADDRAERVRFSLDAGLVKDEYVLDYVWSLDGLTVAWELVEGQLQKAQHGSYVLQPVGTTTKAALRHRALGVPRRTAARSPASRSRR